MLTFDGNCVANYLKIVSELAPHQSWWWAQRVTNSSMIWFSFTAIKDIISINIFNWFFGVLIKIFVSYLSDPENSPQPQQFIARINGRVVDLNQLYTYVIESGGSYKVNQLNLWDEIYCKLFKSVIIKNLAKILIKYSSNEQNICCRRQHLCGIASDLRPISVAVWEGVQH